jgi:ATP-dependent Clp protease protease subunit
MNAEDLLNRRVVVLDGVISDETAKWVIAKLYHLEHLDPVAPVHLWIDSPGGAVLAGLAIITTIKEIRPPVYTLCNGEAHGIAAVVLANGHRGRRQARNGARLSLLPLVWAETQPENEAGMERLVRDLANILAAQTGQPAETIRADFEAGRQLDALQASDYGLIDVITCEVRA